MDVIKQIQDSYKRICSPYCEDNLRAFKIQMLDKPGWLVKIDLSDFDATRRKFAGIKYNNGDKDWLDIHINDFCFEGCGDINKLEDILTVFCELFLLEDKC